MRLLISTFIFLLLSSSAWATTLYVRSDGGTGSQCTGLSNAGYDAGAHGTACALNHPNWVLPPRGESTTRQASTGDTVVIVDGQYRIGCQGTANCTDANVNLVGTAYCHNTYANDCYMGDVPQNVTLIGCSTTGCGCSHSINASGTIDITCTSTRPQLWGAGNVDQILRLASTGGQTIKDLEITDHAGCAAAIGSNRCSGTTTNLSAPKGITLNGASGFTLAYLWIHGLSSKGLYGHTTGNYTMTGLNIDKNPGAAWDADDGTGLSGSNNLMQYGYLTYSGCVEAYPLTGSTSNTASDILNCTDQNYSGFPGYGDAIGTHDGTDGNFIFNHMIISHNVQDGIDFLHATALGTINIYRSKFEGNNGNSLKTSFANNYVENSQLIGNCNYLQQAGLTLDTGFVVCRGGAAQPVAIVGNPNQNLYIHNSTLFSNYDSIIAEGSPGSSQACTGTEIYSFKNSIFYGVTNVAGSGTHASSFYCGGSNGAGAGACCTGVNRIIPSWVNSIVYNTSDSPSGTSMSYTNPHVAQGDNLDPAPVDNDLDFNLTASSTNAIGAASTSVSFTNYSNDYNNYDRGASWDIGALEYGSSAYCEAVGMYCASNSSCCSGACNSSHLCYIPGSYLYNITPIGSIKFQ